MAAVYFVFAGKSISRVHTSSSLMLALIQVSGAVMSLAKDIDTTFEHRKSRAVALR
jgi:hypothetical protein